MTDHSRFRPIRWILGPLAAALTLALLTGCGISHTPGKWILNRSREVRVVRLTQNAATFSGSDTVLIPAGALLTFTSSQEPIISGLVQVFSTDCQLVGQATFGRVQNLLITLTDSPQPTADTAAAEPAQPLGTFMPYREHLTNMCPEN